MDAHAKRENAGESREKLNEMRRTSQCLSTALPVHRRQSDKGWARGLRFTAQHSRFFFFPSVSKRSVEESKFASGARATDWKCPSSKQSPSPSSARRRRTPRVPPRFVDRSLHRCPVEELLRDSESVEEAGSTAERKSGEGESRAARESRPEVRSYTNPSIHS